MRSVPTASVPRDPRFARYLPWQDPGTDNWPLNSPAWIAMGLLLFLPALIVLPFWMLYKIVWQRRWSLQIWLLLPLVALLFLIALVVPNPGDTPPLSPLKARFLVAFWLLPITMFPWQLVAWFRAGCRCRCTWWLGIAAAITLCVGSVIYVVHWRMTPRDEYWVYNTRSIYPFLLGLYFSSVLCVGTVVIEHCLWRPLMNFVRRRHPPTTEATGRGTMAF